MNEQEKIQLIKLAADDERYRRAFAASLSLPISTRVKEQASVRKIFAEDNLPAGALPRYPVEFKGDIKAFLLPRSGSIPMVQVEGDEVFVNTYKLSASARVSLDYLRDGRYNVRDRIQQEIANQLVAQEEEDGWSLIRAAVDANNTINSGETSLTKKLISDMMLYFDQKGYKPDLLVCSVKRAADIRLWGTNELDDTTRREVFRNAGMGSIWGVDILPLRRLADDEVYMFDTSRFGVMPVRQGVTTHEDPTAILDVELGIFAYEEIGFAVLDNTAVVKGVIG